jgi:hypothetical protein
LGSQEASGEVPHTGLGTSIVEALAHQLEATVEKTSGPEGIIKEGVVSAKTTSRTVSSDRQQDG